eukprot:TRINITY_DN3391_c0_g1_i1.p1 TRINITY_DN3391_c0_g1~~TRINITY_DN3391_c0_g1_i1.p1  ORF type:complete len:670 (-),score=103.42 TRINITY_DN3391_c0_g1_i1:4-2013(-)
MIEEPQKQKDPTTFTHTHTHTLSHGKKTRITSHHSRLQHQIINQEEIPIVSIVHIISDFSTPKVKPVSSLRKVKSFVNIRSWDVHRNFNFVDVFASGRERQKDDIDMLRGLSHQEKSRDPDGESEDSYHSLLKELEEAPMQFGESPKLSPKVRKRIFKKRVGNRSSLMIKRHTAASVLMKEEEKAKKRAKKKSAHARSKERNSETIRIKNSNSDRKLKSRSATVKGKQSQEYTKVHRNKTKKRKTIINFPKVMSSRNEMIQSSPYSSSLVFKARKLKGGTIQGIIFCLMMFLHEQDPFYTECLILTHSMYLTSAQFLELLIEMYEENKGNTSSSILLIQRWLETNVYDFKSLSLVERLNKFISSLQKESEEGSTYSHDLLKSWVSSMKSVNQCENVRSNYPGAPEPYITPKITKLLESNDLYTINIEEFSLSDFHPIEVARQITLLDQSYFRRIPVHEFLNKNFENQEKSEYIHRVHDWFNHVSRWIGTEILMGKTGKKRGKVITNIIVISEHLINLQNFNGFLAVMTGLVQFSISRLKNSWKYVSSTHLALFQDFEKLINPVGNFRNLRELYQRKQPPIVPALCTIFHNLILIEDGNDNYLESDFINIEKVLLLGRELSDIKKAQKTHYPLSQVKILSDYITKSAPLSFEALESVSVVAEPPKNVYTK